MTIVACQQKRALNPNVLRFLPSGGCLPPEPPEDIFKTVMNESAIFARRGVFCVFW
jgi:hypothetical protein